MANGTVSRWYADPARLESDLRQHARTATGSLADRIDLTAIRCAAPTLQLLRMLRWIEHSTIERMRVLLVTPTHSDAQVTAFLCTWAYERYWIGAALSKVLDHHGWPTDYPVPGSLRPARLLEEVRHRLLPITEALRTNLIGDPVVAVHLVEGVVEEALTRSAYQAMIEIEPGLTPLVEEVLAIKINHASYFRTRAVLDLAASELARRMVRRRLERLAWPPPGPTLPAAEAAWFVQTIFGPAERRENVVAELAALDLGDFRAVLDQKSRIRFRTKESRS